MHNMGDSEDSEIDVCSVDDEISTANHGGLTLVAAETYVPNSNNTYEEQLVPLTSDDLLTRSKQKALQQGKPRYTKNNQCIKKTNHKEKNIIENSNQITANEKPKGLPRKHKLVENDQVKLPDPIKEENLSTLSTLPNRGKQTETCFNGKEEKAEDSDDELLDRGVNERLNRFHFESDHLAIKNNSDYHALLRTLAVLEAQRTQAIKDLEKLHVLKDESLAEPLKFVKNLRENKLEEFPRRQVVATLPEINWVHYMMAYGGDKYIPQITTRKAVKSQEGPENVMADESEIDLDENSLNGLSTDSQLKSKLDGKPPTHKQKWSIEEQEKLEKLLLLYPPEEVEARRWEKIANALGTRTPQQVSSRIQKYFLKLAKAKLPIPGRGPSGIALNLCKKAKINPVSYKNSSFFPSWRPNVYMSENDKDDRECMFMDDKQDDYPMSDDDDEMIPEELKQTPEYQELMQLKKLKKYKAQKNEEQSTAEYHKGFMCDGCKMDPIVGVRWHCLKCPSDQSTDFCNNCVQRPFTSTVHKEDHQMMQIHKPVESGHDNDYLAFEQRNKLKYNYLDPNFIPCR